MQTFTAGSHRERCRYPECLSTAEHACEFALGGRRTGQRCGMPICEKHSKALEGRRICLAHAELISRRGSGR
jgi:hypothetical protein